MRKLSLLCALLMLFGLSSCFFSREYLTKKEIFALVENNAETLLQSVRSGDFSDCKALDARIRITVNTECVDFYCGGKGITVSGCDYGFYYSEDDLPRPCHAWGDHDGKFKPQENGYILESNDWYYTEKICDYFYYYESGF